MAKAIRYHQLRAEGFSHAEAVQILAADNNQIAVYDLANNVEIPTGGNGGNPYALHYSEEPLYNAQF